MAIAESCDYAFIVECPLFGLGMRGSPFVGACLRNRIEDHASGTEGHVSSVGRTFVPEGLCGWLGDSGREGPVPMGAVSAGRSAGTRRDHG